MFSGMKWWNCLVWVHIDSCPDFCSRLNWLSYFLIVPSSDSISRILSWIPNLVMSSVWSEAFSRPSSPAGLTAPQRLGIQSSPSHFLQSWQCLTWAVFENVGGFLLSGQNNMEYNRIWGVGPGIHTPLDDKEPSTPKCQQHTHWKTLSPTFYFS